MIITIKSCFLHTAYACKENLNTKKIFRGELFCWSMIAAGSIFASSNPHDDNDGCCRQEENKRTRDRIGSCLCVPFFQKSEKPSLLAPRGTLRTKPRINNSARTTLRAGKISREKMLHFINCLRLRRASCKDICIICIGSAHILLHLYMKSLWKIWVFERIFNSCCRDDHYFSTHTHTTPIIFSIHLKHFEYFFTRVNNITYLRFVSNWKIVKKRKNSKCSLPASEWMCCVCGSGLCI